MRSRNVVKRCKLLEFQKRFRLFKRCFGIRDVGKRTKQKNVCDFMF